MRIKGVAEVMFFVPDRLKAAQLYRGQLRDPFGNAFGLVGPLGS